MSGGARMPKAHYNVLFDAAEGIMNELGRHANRQIPFDNLLDSLALDHDREVLEAAVAFLQRMGYLEVKGKE